MAKCLIVAVIAALVSVTFSQQPQQCSEFLDIMFVVDGSSSVFPFLNEYRGGLVNLIQRLDINGATRTTKVQVGICYFGSGSQLVVPLTLANNRGGVISAVQTRPFPGGLTAVNEGKECAAAQFQRNGRPGAGRVVVCILDGNPTTPDLENDTIVSVNNLKALGTILSVIAVGDGFTNVNRLRPLASDPLLFITVATFADFTARTNEFFDAICPEAFITTTTPRPTTQAVVVPGGPCENCIIINGIGYAEATDCWHYWQCIMQEDGTWREMLRKTAIGAYWDQNIISQQAAALSLCPLDPCRNQPDGTNMEGFDNCRATIVCSGGRTIDAGCCPPGERASGAGCTPDSTCTDRCPEPLDTTPGPCNLTPNTAGSDQRIYFANDGQTTIQMSCGPGTIFDLPLCTCVHDGLDLVPVECLPNPEVDLRFTADGGAIDQSRNGYSITTENLATAPDSQPGASSTGFVGVFNGQTLVRITNANSDLTREFTMRVVYDNSGSQPNAAVVANAECAGTQPTISIGANPNGATGSVVTVGNGADSVSSTGSGRQTVVFHYNGENADISINGGLASSVATGPLLVSAGQTCDGIKLGLGRTQPAFNGNIVEFQLWKCIANP